MMLCHNLSTDERDMPRDSCRSPGGTVAGHPVGRKGVPVKPLWLDGVHPEEHPWTS